MSKANSNFRTSAQLEQQKQWWARQQGWVVSSFDPWSVPMLVEAAVGPNWSPQKPKAAKSAVSHTTSSRTPAQRSRETAIREDFSTLEEARQLPDDAHASRLISVASANPHVMVPVCDHANESYPIFSGDRERMLEGSSCVAIA